jgi:hypothetical protein
MDGALMNGISALIKKTNKTDGPSPPQVDTEKRQEDRKRALTRNSISQNFDLRTPNLQNCGT